MEDIYELKKFRLLYTKKIDLKKFFAQYSQSICPFFKIRKKGEGLRSLLEIDNDDEYAKLKLTMDPNKGKNMTIPKSFVPRRRFLESWPHYELPEHRTKLVTHANLKKETRDEKYKRIKNVRYYGKIVLEVTKSPDDMTKIRNLHPLQDYVVCVRVESIFDLPGGKKYYPSQEFWVPGNLTLEKIKDRIICQEDFQLAHPVIDSPHQRSNERKMDLNKNGIFYIGKDFFVDKRHCEEDSYFDYSVEVRQWMKSKNIDSGNVHGMQCFQIMALPVRLGYPYLYMHQGKCEHLIFFTDARLLKYKEDVLHQEDYPLLKSFAAIKGRYCVLCLIRLAKLCVLGCEIIPYENAFICNMCALSYLYDSQGNKKTSFIIYKYVDRSGIL